MCRILLWENSIKKLLQIHFFPRAQLAALCRLFAFFSPSSWMRIKLFNIKFSLLTFFSLYVAGATFWGNRKKIFEPLPWEDTLRFCRLPFRPHFCLRLMDGKVFPLISTGARNASFYDIHDFDVSPKLIIYKSSSNDDVVRRMKTAHSEARMEYLSISAAANKQHRRNNLQASCTRTSAHVQMTSPFNVNFAQMLHGASDR